MFKVDQHLVIGVISWHGLGSYHGRVNYHGRGRCTQGLVFNEGERCGAQGDRPVGFLIAQC